MGLLMAAAGHGPGMHGVAVSVIVIGPTVIAVIAGLVRAVRSRNRSAKHSQRDQGREA
jgi:hypothetical protein